MISKKSLKTNFIWLLAQIILITPCFSVEENRKEMLVKGSVFLDLNKNGLRELNEPPVTGIELIESNKSRHLNKLDGSFEINSFVEDEFAEVKVNKDSLPPGSYVTTQDGVRIYKNGNRFKVFDIGLYFLEKKTVYDFSPTGHENKFLVIPELIDTRFSLRSDGIYVNERRWARSDLFFEKTLLEKESFILGFDTDTLEIFQDELKLLKNFVKQNIQKVRTVEIIVSMPKPLNDIAIREKQRDLIANDARIAVLSEGIADKNIKVIKQWGIKSLNINFYFFNNDIAKCSVKFDDRRTRYVSLQQDFSLRHGWGKPIKGSIKCADKQQEFSIPAVKISNGSYGKNPLFNFLNPGNKDYFQIKFDSEKPLDVVLNGNVLDKGLVEVPVKQFEKQYDFFLTMQDGFNLKVPVEVIQIDYLKEKIKNTQQYLEIYQSKYVDESRDLNIHIRGKAKNLQKVSINGRLFTPKEFDEITYSLKGNKGVNKVKYSLVGENDVLKNYSEEIDLYSWENNITAIRYGAYRQVSTAKNFNTKFTLPIVYRAEVDTLHRLKKTDYKVHGMFATDISTINLTKFDGTETTARNFEGQFHLVKSFWGDAKKYNSIQYRFYLGGLFKKFDSDPQVRVQVPQDLFALHGIAELFLPDFYGMEDFDLSFRAFFGKAINDLNDYNIGGETRLRINLNQLGRILNAQKYFTYTNQYKGWNKINLELSAKVERDIRTIVNTSDEELSNFNYYLSAGLSFAY